METLTMESNEIAQQHQHEVLQGERFEFGKNWARFLETLNEEKIKKAEESLREMLDVKDLRGKSFLDIGSGSGLFSLAARRLGARVFSFDFDTDSFACTTELKRRYFENDDDWAVEQNSALDADYLKSLGKFDFVYSWGVLHHTGEMWKGLTNVDHPVKSGGKLFIAIYNDTGSQARRWLWIKKTYCRLPEILKTPFALITILPNELKYFVSKTINPDAHPSETRGMNRWHDIIDWVGGYPYEVATPDEIFDFYAAKGYRLTKLKCGNVGLGCNEFVFEKN